MFRRITLFLLINIIVVFTISVVLSTLGVRPYLTANGLDLEALMIFCLVWGMAGSLISLALSRKMAKWLTRVQLVGPEHEVYQMVAQLARDAGLPATPEVGIFDSSQMNAFATGPTKRRSLVAVSTALLSRMEKGELEAVLAHEISHISNGDMVTMTLLQGVVNAFVMFLARVLAYAVTAANRSNNRRSSYGSYYLFTFLFEILFMIGGALIVTAFSRMREFRADRGAAILTRKEKMIAALERLKGERAAPTQKKSAITALMISMPRRGLSLFATHPSLEARIKRLQET